MSKNYIKMCNFQHLYNFSLFFWLFFIVMLFKRIKYDLTITDYVKSKYYLISY